MVLKAGILYFAFVFGAGFVLGPIRLLRIVPQVGTRMAELLEMPVMLVVIIAAARLVGPLQGYSIDEYFSTRDPVSGTVYYVLLIVYALMPFLLTQRRNI
jgi:hypothetical protein